MGVEILATLMIASFAAGFWIRYKEPAARAWPQAMGKIIKSETLRQSAGQGREEVQPIIEYEFSYQGKLFKSSHWRLGNFSIGNSISAGAVTSRYPVGLPVTVFVNSREPMKSVLETKPSLLCWVPFGFGFLILLVFFLILFAITQRHP